MSGASTPGGGVSKSLSDRDLEKADEALAQVKSVDSVPNFTLDGTPTTNGVAS
jgi:hypothetical protein